VSASSDHATEPAIDASRYPIVVSDGRKGRLLAPSIPVSSSAFVSDDVADQHLALRHMRLIDHPLLAAAIALDPEKPRRKCAERFAESLFADGSGAFA
jgi:hypothetical protein